MTEPKPSFPETTAMRYDQYLRARREYITSLAHRYWLERGCPEGSPEVDWYLAELRADQDLIAQMVLGPPA
jgi:Protein of unknown function (DUF2934)